MLWWTVQNTMVIAMLTAIVAIACRLGRFRPAIEHALWLVVLLKFLTPAVVYWPWSVAEIWGGLTRSFAASSQRLMPESAQSRNVHRSGEQPPHDSVMANGVDSLPGGGGTGAPSASMDHGWLVPGTTTDSHSEAVPAFSADLAPDLARPVTSGLAVRDVLSGPANPVASAELTQETVGDPLHPDTAETLPAWSVARVAGLFQRANEVAMRWQLEGRHIVWLFVAPFGCWQIVRLFRSHRKLRSASVAPPWLARQVRQLAAKLGVREPQTLVVPGLASPIVWCLGRAKLLWPAALTYGSASDKSAPLTLLVPPAAGAERRGEGSGTVLSEGAARWDGVIAHELAHLRRGDHWIAWLEFAAVCLWWWNPLFWFVRRRLHGAAEFACDAWAVWAVPNGERTFAESLLEVTRLVSRTGAPVPALGVSTGARRSFERRLTMILSERVPCKLPWRGLLAAAVLALLALPGWMVAQEPEVSDRAPQSDSAAPPTLGVIAAGASLEEPAPPAAVRDRTDVGPPAINVAPIGAAVPDPAAEITGYPVQTSPTQDPNDSRISRLEQQLELLLREIRSIRSEQRLKIQPNEREVVRSDAEGNMTVERWLGDKLISSTARGKVPERLGILPGESIVARINEKGYPVKQRWKDNRLLSEEVIPVGDPAAPTVGAQSVAPDGRVIAVPGSDGTISLLDAASRKELRRFSIGDGRQPTALAFSPDGKLLIARTNDGKVIELEPSTGKIVRTGDAPPATISGYQTGSPAGTIGAYGAGGDTTAIKGSASLSARPGPPVAGTSPQRFSGGPSSAGPVPSVAANVASGTHSALAQATGGVQLDLVKLATEYSDAVGNVKLARGRLELAQGNQEKGLGPAADVLTAQVSLDTAAHKLRLLRAIAEAAAEATKVELEYVRNLAEKDYASASHEAQGRARLRILELILNEQGSSKN